ncbi:hypothetical protein RFI_17844 [Reticulomyxa filosa]|uniref:Uncharacterized protein n=1 Tax=Reticulomyxa filosa TaxID=46433 RepID=X6N030_RETFI|nr:hypothetical protein RFI_17844 [Reticulomyxa filosa]|eukprot:ETO19386.1 hypothetical protein RFI_17844 [Reticulomyxa filosa]
MLDSREAPRTSLLFNTLGMQGGKDPVSSGLSGSCAGLYEPILWSFLGKWKEMTSGTETTVGWMDAFQKQLFGLLHEASDKDVGHFMEVKATQMYRFVMALFVMSLHKSHPLRVGIETKTEKEEKKGRQEEMEYLKKRS